MRTSKEKSKQDEWLCGMLRLQSSLNSTIHNMIIYRRTSGPWDNRTVNDGWNVLHAILDGQEEELRKLK